MYVLRTECADEPVGGKGAALGIAFILQGQFPWNVGHAEKAERLVQESQSTLRKLGARRELALCNNLAAIIGIPRDDPEAQQLLEESSLDVPIVW